MRELGYRVVDLLVEAAREGGPPLVRASPEQMRRSLAGPPPDSPQPFETVLKRLERDVLPFRSRVDHPRFLAFIPGSGTWPGALADLIASACNVYAGSWMESAGPSQIELEVLGWFKDWIGYPAEAAGSLIERRLGREHDRARVRPRGEGGRHARRPRALRLRPDPFVDRAGSAHPRLSARAGARAPDRARPAAFRRARSPRRWRPTCGPAGLHLPSAPTQARRTAASVGSRCASSRPCAGGSGPGSTSTRRTAASRS